MQPACGWWSRSSQQVQQAQDQRLTRPAPSRVLQPPGGGSSNLFGGYEDDSAALRRPNKMASKLFAPPEEVQSGPKRSNPPGGKSSGIFGDPEPQTRQQRHKPPGGQTSNIFGAAESAPAQTVNRMHPNKPKDNLGAEPEPKSSPVSSLPAPEATVAQPEVKEEVPPPSPMPAKEEPAVVLASPEPRSPPPSSPPPEETSPNDGDGKNHEPHLGPKPRSHNRVLNPPGGKSSVVFY
uniref:Jupiter microtubule associated homolog 2 n=1 Tax=Gasterosteus aculeatus aculeatus TaxID=481459 RepID=A0AAQ4P9F1_GASAC